MITIKYKELLLKENIDKINKIVKNDGVIIYPTDTLYGLGGNFLSLPVIKKIDQIKNRSDMPYSVAVSGMKMLKSLVTSLPPSFESIYDSHLPGKFTFLFEASKSLSKAHLKGSKKIGIRVPDIKGILTLIAQVGVPFITTSVNASGTPSLNSPTDITKAFSNLPPEYAPALLIDAGSLPQSKGSTIIDLTQNPHKCLRQGDGVF
ncbi:MAG: threonylcarbamoyl-AMP synthase [bacterium]|nr:threonylcarbamoyl-AMP synthase [bacterium]